MKQKELNAVNEATWKALQTKFKGAYKHEDLMAMAIVDPPTLVNESPHYEKGAWTGGMIR